ncbi:demethylmenaquinone methyltransferase [Scytonema sp. NUACC21]
MNKNQLSNTNSLNITPLSATKLTGDNKRNYIRQLFNNISTRYDFINNLIFLGHIKLWHQWALSDLELKPGTNILDIGCGTGHSTQYLHYRYPGLNIEGMDLSPGMLSEARRLHPHLNFFEGDVCAIPRPDATYDLVTTIFTFRNFPNHQTPINEMLRVLRPGGKLLILDLFYPQEPLWWQKVYTFWIKKIIPAIVIPFIEDPTPYSYLGESIINGLNVSDFKLLLEDHGASVSQINSYTGGAAVKLIAVRKNL